MRNLLIILLSFAFPLANLGQRSSNFLFDNYQNALIIYKDGQRFQAPVNFDLLAGHFLFVDAKDKKAKQFAYPEKIAFLQIGSRSFQLSEGEAIEILQAEPLFQVAYSGNLRSIPKKLTYGGTTQTAAVDTYSGYSGSTVLSSQKSANNKKVVGINKRYKAKFGKKIKHFNNGKTFLKILPVQQQKEIKEYIETNEIDFDNVEQVLKLYEYVIINLPKT